MTFDLCDDLYYNSFIVKQKGHNMSRPLSDIAEEVRLNGAAALVKIDNVSYIMNPKKNTYEDMQTREEMVILQVVSETERKFEHFSAETEAVLVYWL